MARPPTNGCPPFVVWHSAQYPALASLSPFATSSGLKLSGEGGAIGAIAGRQAKPANPRQPTTPSATSPINSFLNTKSPRAVSAYAPEVCVARWDADSKKFAIRSALPNPTPRCGPLRINAAKDSQIGEDFFPASTSPARDRTISTAATAPASTRASGGWTGLLRSPAHLADSGYPQPDGLCGMIEAGAGALAGLTFTRGVIASPQGARPPGRPSDALTRTGRLPSKTLRSEDIQRNWICSNAA